MKSTLLALLAGVALAGRAPAEETARDWKGMLEKRTFTP
jgi:hypothetical protein